MLPVIRQQPFYPGQAGVGGSDVERGLRERSEGIVLFVDTNHPMATDAGDGTDPENPLLTITGAMTRLTALQTAIGKTLIGSVIVIAPGTYAESVTTPTGTDYVTVIGGGSNDMSPSWTSGSADLPCLIVASHCWRFTGIRFHSPLNVPSVVLSRGADVPWGTAGNDAASTTIDHCMFLGNLTGMGGLAFHGAPALCFIRDNWFYYHNNAGNTAYGISVTSAGSANPYMCRIERNMFVENDNHITRAGGIGSFNVSMFLNNTFMTGSQVPTTGGVYLDLRAGTLGMNTVNGNVFPGDYSNTGGYYANAAAPGNWVGNMAEDVLEAQVADNGFTIAPPAA